MPFKLRMRCTVNEEYDFQKRLTKIEKICEEYLQTSNFPKDVVIKYIIDVSRGDTTFDNK